jgi:hypothetical protein
MGYAFTAGRIGAAGALLLAACGAPPGGDDNIDALRAFDWAAVIDGVEPALLSVCTADGNATVVGGNDGRGLILEWAGDGWHAAPLAVEPPTLWWCAGSGPGAWAVGERGAVLRRGDGWVPVDTGDVLQPTTTLYGVWTDGAATWVVGGDATAGGARPVIARHRAAEGWQAIDTAALPDVALFKVWGSGADDVWAVGTGGVILHFDGDAWTPTTSPTDDRLIAVWGTTADDVYAVGGDGVGLVLRWDGAAWTTFASTPEPLSGVWRAAAGGPLYVGGNRGWLGRFAVKSESPPGTPADADQLTSVVPIANVDLHALSGAGGSVLAVGADLLAGGDPSWLGRLLVHGGGFGGDVELPPDAGVADAATDADPTDGGSAGPGAACPELPDTCAAGLECWLLLESDVAICTRYCDSPADCGDYGPDACCELPGFQALDPVCIPAMYTECN